MEKVTLVLGASSNPDRFAFKAVKSLQRRNIPFIAIGRKDFDLDDFHIMKSIPDEIGSVHTIAMYMNSKNQKEYYKVLLSLHPKRIIFNPGTTNPEFAELAKRNGIEVVNDCMLVLLNTGKF